MVVTALDNQGVQGVVLFGTVAGAPGVVKIHALAAAEREMSLVLAASVVSQCVRDGGRMIVYELADDPLFQVTAGAMPELGFAEEGRVANFVSDGVDLLLLVWRSR